jgi:alkanesulfonate monooxygenase SsuD/methylene tetrahydromethanopterin reductase-like flavin-dependent oxidoreductase (luciferase family)
MIRLGTFLLAAQFPGRSHAQALAGALDCALASEAAGLDSVWIAEHHIADRHADAAAELRAAMPAWLAHGLGGYVRIAPASRPPRDPRAYTEHLLGIHPVGTPEQGAERLATTAERTGIDRFLLMVEGSGDHRRATETIARLGAEVLPLLSRRASHRDGNGGSPNQRCQTESHADAPCGSRRRLRPPLPPSRG